MQSGNCKGKLIMEFLNGFEKSSVEKAALLLRDGEVVAFPTETVYGLGADVFNPYAVARVFEIKKRPRFDPLIVHICEKDWIYRVAEDVPPEAQRLMYHFWPGPLTMILPKKKDIPDVVTAGLSTVGIRMPSHPVALHLISELGVPIAAPSANPFGYISPTRADHVRKLLGDAVPMILDGGDSVFGIESTIVSIRDKNVYIHRHGAISAEELSAVAGSVHEKGEGGVCEAPGELPYHYAPSKPLRLIDTPVGIETEKSAFLSFGVPEQNVVSKYIKVLSEKRDLREAAANFFSSLIELDNKDVEIIYAEKIPETGLGKAMMDRLRKASKKYRHTTR